MPSIREIDFAQPAGFRPLSLDLRTPENADAPLVVFLHGGGWLRGSRKVFTPGISDADSFDRIVAAGIAIASCEYRLSGEARFPAQLDDVDAALAWLQTHGAEHGVDASRIVVWGVSAGATLAALTALRRSDIRGVVDWFGPADLFTMAEHDMGDPPAETREARWLGAPAIELPDAARLASAALQVHAGAPPFHISHGTDDQHVPFAQSEALAAALSAAGAEVEFHPVEGGRHFWQGLADTAPVFDRAIDFTVRVTN
ncbi:Acetyl esterase/lipase [Microbacterium sp. cf046]|uniref:alpha/beta hydrolase n=1 Tax=Microbacterium sp. cf046 TaxID=1761803 RepID=UPI0008EBEF2A|nr:alpha/beta hydrolase [Microbacterium sp. cf046]SFS13078.1 Acetyl esterase/lipase [Microbacterium sp. cf046]